jgi:hypothetical protein
VLAGRSNGAAFLQNSGMFVHSALRRNGTYVNPIRRYSMRSRTILIATAVCALVVAGLASSAMAATPEGDPASGKFPVPGTGTSGTILMSVASGTTISCTSGTGSGQATSKTTGEGSGLMHGCSAGLVSCTSAGQPAGTIKLESTISHLVYLDENHTVPGVLTTPPASGVFTKFSCGGIPVEVKGTGLLTRIVSPECGKSSATATVAAETTAPGTQRYLQIEETGSVYDLTANVAGGPFQTAAIATTATGTAAQSVTLTCPEQK